MCTGDVLQPYGAQGGEEGAPPAASPAAGHGRWRPDPAPVPDPGGGGGWVWCWGRGPKAGFPRTFRKTPVCSWGASGSRRVSAHKRRAGPGRETHSTSQPGADQKAGRTGSLNFPECVHWGRGGRSGLGAISHASPPRLESPAHSPAPGLLAGWGARVAGEGALAAHGGGEGRKLSKEGQKGWGRRNWLFLLLFFWFFVFSNKRFWKADRSGEPPSPEYPPRTHLLLPLSQVASRGLVAATPLN